MRTLTRNRWDRLTVRAAAVVLVAAAWVGCAAANPTAVPLPGAEATTGRAAIGALAPELETVPIRKAGPLSLAEARGKVVLVDFWATFCEPCKALLQEYGRWAAELDGELVVIAVSVDEPEDVDRERLAAFVEDLSLPFGVVWDRSQRTVALYDPPSMPTSYLIDPGGTLLGVYPGGTRDELERLRQDVEALLRHDTGR